ncbi:MAG: DUF6266 family protein [Ginsengibacter sp.]
MATINSGILGGFSGKVGTVTGYSRYGKNIMRSATSTVTDKPTPGRLAQREKVKMCNAFMKAFARTGFFSKTFPHYGQGGSGYNRAMGILLNKALYGNYPDYGIDYEKFLVSCGPLPEPSGAAANATPSHDILFTWTNNTGEGTAKAGDKAVLAAYFPALGQIVFSWQAGTRATGQGILPAQQLQGYTAETWLGFLSADEKDAANSVYTGLVIV